jgi:ribosomal protein S12 methylthiotransferase
MARYYIDPFGCAKNQVDAENMMLYLDNAGWSSAQSAEDADLIIVNSCGFIESAKQESINAVLLWRSSYPGKKILLSGCLAQRYAKELAESLPEANGFFGVEDVTKIVEAVNSLFSSANFPQLPRTKNSTTEDTEKEEQNKLKLRAVPQDSLTPCTPWFNILPATRPLLSLPGSAYVKISEGCDNRCAYCAIPLIRGPLRCRTVPDIVEECKGLLARGIKELCIIGQDIGSYRSDGLGLPELLTAIAGLTGDFWVRLLYMHPDHFPLPVLDTMERDTRFLPYFDIPFQHASPQILSAMNRHGNATDYVTLVETIRARLPAAVIRSTFLLGFPGETDADFAALLDFQYKLRLDWLGCFAYSHEEDTPAYTMPQQIPQKIAAQRKRKIEKCQIPITEQNMDRFVDQNLNVLLEEQISGEENNPDTHFWLGRLYCHAPEVDGAAVVIGANAELKAGDIIPCEVIGRRGFDLEVRT